MSLDQGNSGVHVLSETLGDTELVGEGAWTSVTRRQDIPPPQSQDAWVSVPSRPWLTLGSHLQGLSIFTIWRRPRKAFSFLCVCAEVQITINIDSIFQACVKGMCLILMCSEII